MRFFILIVTLSLVISASAAFNQNNLRYLSGPEILQSLFAVGIKPASDGTNCQYFTDENQAALGINSPSTGRPASSGPSVATIDLISRCVSAYFESKIYNDSVALEWIGPTFKTAPSPASILQSNWKTYPFQSKEAIVSHLVKKILGPDELIEDYGLVSSAQALKQSLQNNIPLKGDESVQDIIKQLTITLVLRDEFLSY